DCETAAGLCRHQTALHDRAWESGMKTIAEFAAAASPPEAARAAATRAFVDTIGVALAGAVEPAAEIVRRVIGAGGPCVVFGSDRRASAVDAALANGTAAHALDYDDMCFVSLAHPSAPLVAAAW